MGSTWPHRGQPSSSGHLEDGRAALRGLIHGRSPGMARMEVPDYTRPRGSDWRFEREALDCRQPRMRLTAHWALTRRRSALQRRRTILALGVLCASLASGTGAHAEAIAAARYEAPVARYGHFAPGRPHEYARVAAATDRGRSLELQLPEDEVFEDVAPRLVKLAASEAAEILAIVSRRDEGSRLVMIRLHDDRLEVSAESPAIGVPITAAALLETTLVMMPINSVGTKNSTHEVTSEP